MSDELRDLAAYFGDDGWEWADGEPFDGAGAVARVKDRLGGVEAERDRLRGALMDATAHLVGATSAYKEFARRHAKFGRPQPDPFYGTRSKDFERAIARARAAIREGGGDDAQ